MTLRLSGMLYLKPGELRRILPFFALYLLLFAAFTVADGLSLALFVKRVGAANLPFYYGITALANIVLMGGYMLLVERAGSVRMFQIILGMTLLLYLGAWSAIRWLGGGSAWYGALFVSREISYTLVLMHFGTYLQEYFSREELNRALPVVYAGGRVGGIAGGWVLEHVSPLIGIVDMVLVFAGLCLTGMAVLVVLSWRLRPIHTPKEDEDDPDVIPASEGDVEKNAHTSLGGFLRLVWASPLLFWITITSVLFMLVRWLLNYEYNSFFESYFASSEEMAEYLGGYTQVALALSLLVQLLVVNRLVAWIGVGGTYLAYSALVAAGAALNALPMTLAMAVFSRVVETELRFGLRNPIMQMMTNKFSRSLRIRVRAWTMGILTPVGTLSASVLLRSLAHGGGQMYASAVGAALGLAYLGCSVGLWRSFHDRPSNEGPHASELSPTLHSSTGRAPAARQTVSAPAPETPNQSDKVNSRAD